MLRWLTVFWNQLMEIFIWMEAHQRLWWAVNTTSFYWLCFTGYCSFSKSNSCGKYLYSFLKWRWSKERNYRESRRSFWLRLVCSSRVWASTTIVTYCLVREAHPGSDDVVRLSIGSMFYRLLSLWMYPFRPCMLSFVKTVAGCEQGIAYRVWDESDFC